VPSARDRVMSKLFLARGVQSGHKATSWSTVSKPGPTIRAKAVHYLEGTWVLTGALTDRTRRPRQEVYRKMVRQG
jgi:hypothetical protein